MTKIILKYFDEAQFTLTDNFTKNDLNVEKSMGKDSLISFREDNIPDLQSSVDEIQTNKDYYKKHTYIFPLHYVKEEYPSAIVEQWKSKATEIIKNNIEFLSNTNVFCCVNDLLESWESHADSLDYLIKRFPSVKFFALTANKRFLHSNSVYADRWQNRFVAYNNIVDYKPNKTYINLTRVARRHRCLLLDVLYSRNLISAGYNTFGNAWDNFNLNYKAEFTKTNIESIDFDVLDVEDLQSVNPNYFVPRECERSFLFLTTETCVRNNNMFFTEKTYKPIGIGMPFILLGNPGMLQDLRNRGYVTFDEWWDESYDHDIPVEHRINMIVDVIDKLNKYDVGSLLSIRDEMKSVLEHNLNLYKTLRRKNQIREGIRQYINEHSTNNS